MSSYELRKFNVTCLVRKSEFHMSIRCDVVGRIPQKSDKKEAHELGI